MSSEREPLLNVDSSENFLVFKAKMKRKIGVNFLAICIIFVCIYTAHCGIENIETNVATDIGPYVLTSITAGELVSCIVAPTVISFIGTKGCLMTGSFFLGVLIAAHFYPRDFLLIPAATFYGLTTGSMLTAQGVFVTTLAIQYAGVIGDSAETVISRFFGLFCMAFQSTEVWGNLLFSVIIEFSDSGSKNGTMAPPNISIPCGADFDPRHAPPTNATKSNTPESKMLYKLLIVYLSLVIVGFLVSMFALKPIYSTIDWRSIGLRKLMSMTLHTLWTESNMMLLIPMAMYCGIEQVVMYVYYSQAYVECAVGLGWVGYTMICYGVANAFFSPVNGFLAKHIGRPSIFLLGLILNLSTLGILRFWPPDKSQMVIFFVIPSLWGMGDAIWLTQTCALVGNLFPNCQEAAFANIWMFQALGFMVVYLYSSYIVQSIQLYLVTGWLMFAVTLVIIVEFRIRTQAQLGFRQLIISN